LDRFGQQVAPIVWLQSPSLKVNGSIRTIEKHWVSVKSANRCGNVRLTFGQRNEIHQLPPILTFDGMF
jgi:hypothetical protein